ncbi:vWA domain-containing protein [Clostridium sp. UBA4548]|uniref:vWA domain-containing protein n=1 Tax=Clostridium sp. UBA4548 TaxID=1946361 RepID=UPI0025C3D5DD|nr:VWA domain-containing protein [Clostridium sp. UBA4548]
MKKYILRNKLFLKIIIVFVLIGILGVAYKAYAAGEKPELNINASASKPSVYVNEEFDINYTINPQPLNVSDINKKVNKEIILVIDTSGSMDELITSRPRKTRMEALKDAANNFISKFQNENTTKIGIVTYDYNGRNTKSLTNATYQEDLKAIINGLDANGATNIGDGIRVAQKMFSSDISVKKYLVLMSDGMPTSLTYSGYAGGYNDDYNKYDYQSRNYTYYRLPNDLRKGDRTWQYFSSINDTTDLKYGTYGNTDPKGYCLEYSTLMAENLKSLKITNYVIGFSGGSDSTKLTQIASAGAGSYYDAKDAETINSVYLDIADKIKADFSVEGATINFSLPDGLEYVMNTFDTQVNGNNYSKLIPSIVYKLNSNNTQYIAEPLSISLNLKGNKKGVYELAGTNWNLSYKVINGNAINKLLPKVTITVEKYNAEFQMSRKLIPEQNQGKFNVNNEFTMEYSITPNPIQIQSTEKQKEIMLVVDTSGSMDWSVDKDEKVSGKPSRLELTKTALNNFINKFNNSTNVKIGLITYSNRGNVFTYNNNYLFEASNSQVIRDKVSALSANGGTNLGDGIRKSIWALSDNKDSKKFVVLMTDGEPTFYSYYGSYYYRNYYTEIDNKNVDYNENNDLEKGLEYSNIMAGILKENKDLDLKTFAIGFSKGANADKLKEIAVKAGGDYLDATSDNENAITEVYSNIAEQIKADLALENVKFTQQLPEGLVLSETGGNSITKDLKVNYTYNSTTKQYEAEPISFTVKVKGTKVGSYELKDDAKLSYKDLDGTSSEKFFDPLSISILDSFIIKQGLFQPNGNNTNIIHVGEKNIKYISNLNLDIAPNSEYQLATFVRTNGQETPINIKLNSSNNTEVTKMKVISVNVFTVNSDGTLTKLTSIAPIIENDSSASPNIKVTLNGETTSEYKYYIINYNYVVNEAKEDTNSMIINRANIIGTDKFNDFNTRITSMPDVF